MKEIVFLNKNSSRWKKFEAILNKQEKADPDVISGLYIQLTDDLAYAKTFYPNSNTTFYLNNLTLKAHQNIYKNKKIKRNKLFHFWKYKYPLIIRSAKKEIFISLGIFIIAVLIGIVSSAYDDSFARLILGDGYVNMTLENIDKGDPMAVYKSMNQSDMFLWISMNNIKVAFLAFVYGIFLSFGTGYILLQNGIMLGTFQYFFYKHGLLTESILSIWIHGTIEIFAIIVAGAAGLVLGNSILFPKTLPRKTSFIRGALKGVKLVGGLVPFFLLAAFFEGFITRLTGMPDLLKLLIILGSLALIVYYFFLNPEKIYSSQHKKTNHGKSKN